MGQHRRSLFQMIALVAVVAVVGAACGEDGEEEDGGGPGGGEIAIGLLTDLTGPFKSFGTDIQIAVDLAVEELEAEGDLDLRIMLRDTGGDPQQAVVGLRELAAQEEVFAVIGPVSSGEAEVAFAQAASQEIPILTGTANKEGITELGEGWAFRDTATNTQLYSASMPLYQEEFGVTSVALIFDEQQAFAAAAAGFAIPNVAMETGIEIVDQLTIQTGQSDFTSVVQRVQGIQDIDGLFVITAPVEGGLLATELDRQGVDLPVLGHPAQNSGAFRETAGPVVEDWVVPSVLDPTAANPRAQQFSETMGERDEDPPTVPEAGNYYDIVYMLAQVLEEGGIDAGTDPTEARASIREGLANLQGFEGIAGSVSFLPNGDVDRPVFTLLLSGTETTVLG